MQAVFVDFEVSFPTCQKKECFWLGGQVGHQSLRSWEWDSIINCSHKKHHYMTTGWCKSQQPVRKHNSKSENAIANSKNHNNINQKTYQDLVKQRGQDSHLMNLIGQISVTVTEWMCGEPCLPESHRRRCTWSSRSTSTKENWWEHKFYFI